MPTVTIPGAIAGGVICGAGAIVLHLVFRFWSSGFVLPYLAALATTAACGLYILLNTLYDGYRNPRRGTRIRAIRRFDVAAGLLLAGPALWALLPYVRAL